jgi:hypothetical protein
VDDGNDSIEGEGGSINGWEKVDGSINGCE